MKPKPGPETNLRNFRENDIPQNKRKEIINELKQVSLNETPQNI